MARPPSRVLLLLRGQRLGDAVVSLAFSAAVKEAFPEAEVWAAGPRTLEPVLGNDSSLAGVRSVPHPEWRHPLKAVRAWRGLKDMGFDVAFVLGIHFLSSAIGRLVSKHAVGYDYNHRGWLLDRALVPHVSCNRSGWEYGPETRPLHITDFWGRLLEAVTGERPAVSWRGLDLQVHDPAAGRFLTRSLTGESRLLVFHPYAGSVIRTWPESLARVFVDLVLQRTDWRLAVTGGPQDREAARLLASRGPERIAAAAGELALGETWALLSRADLLVSVDTAVIHMAAAQGRPVVSLFGPGDPLVWGPHHQAGGVIQRNEWCQRCKRARCLHPGLPCMAALDPELVLERASAMMPQNR